MKCRGARARVCACDSEPIVPDLTARLDELKRVKERQDAQHSQELDETDEKLETMKELLLTENALLRQSLYRSAFYVYLFILFVK